MPGPNRRKFNPRGNRGSGTTPPVGGLGVATHPATTNPGNNNPLSPATHPATETPKVAAASPIKTLPLVNSKFDISQKRDVAPAGIQGFAFGGPRQALGTPGFKGERTERTERILSKTPPPVNPKFDISAGDKGTGLDQKHATNQQSKWVPTKEQDLPQPNTYETTDLGAEAMDKFSEYALADEDPQVTAERDRLERNNLLRTEQARRMAHSNAIRAGFQPGSAQYEQMMRDTVSGAENEGIAATNSFNDFVRGRRADQQRELEGIATGEFGKLGTQQARETQAFNNLVKFLPSDKAQQMLAVSQAKGLNINEAMTNMYDESGELKAEFKDLTESELVKQGLEQAIGQMTINPETSEAWKGDEQSNYIEKFYAENFQNIIAPSQGQAEIATETGLSKDRVDKAVTSGSFGDLTQADWNNITDTQIIKAKQDGSIREYDSTIQKGDNWADLDNMNDSDAKAYWLSNNPISAPENKGKIIEKDGVLYEITDPMKVVGLGGDNKRISVMARPVKGGPEISLKNSTRWEGTTASFFDDLF